MNDTIRQLQSQFAFVRSTVTELNTKVTTLDTSVKALDESTKAHDASLQAVTSKTNDMVEEMVEVVAVRDALFQWIGGAVQKHSESIERLTQRTQMCEDIIIQVMLFLTGGVLLF